MLVSENTSEFANQYEIEALPMLVLLLMTPRTMQMTVLKEDNKFIFKAAAEAQKATDYILRRRQSEGG